MNSVTGNSPSRVFFDKFILNFHAVLLILHVFQVDMIYMYINSGVVYKCSQLTTLGDLFRNGTPHHFSGRQTGPILIFFLISLLGAKRLLYMECKDKENTICQQFHWLFPKYCLCIISN